MRLKIQGALFSVVSFSRETLPQKRGKRALLDLVVVVVWNRNRAIEFRFKGNQSEAIVSFGGLTF